MKRFNFVLLLTLSLTFLVIAFRAGQLLRQMIKKEPVLENYMTDMNCYLKTYYLIEKGIPFYQAYALAEKGDAGTDSYPGEIWGWKTAFLFYLWKLLPGVDGRSIYWLFVLLILSIPWVSFLIGKELMGEKYAFLSALLVWPYFILPLQDLTFMQVEWWALILFFWGFYFLLKKQDFLAATFFSLALFSRELFAIHLFSLLIVLFFTRKKKISFWLFLPLISIFLFYFLIHIPNVGQYENLKNLNSWWRQSRQTNIFSNWQYVRVTLAFNSANYYFLTRFFPFRISLLVSTFSLLYLYWKKREIKYLFCLASFLPFFLFQFKPGMMTLYHDYWGIYYVPLTLIAAPTIIRVLYKRHCEV